MEKRCASCAHAAWPHVPRISPTIVVVSAANLIFITLDKKWK